MRYAIGELFCGAGGLAAGALKATANGSGFRHSWASDIDKDACNTYRQNIPVDMVHCSRVEDLNFNALPSIDGLAFGFPCNDFSIVGKRRGIAGDFGNMYRYAVKALEHFKPSFFVAENVDGLASSGQKKDLETILDSFADAGYRVSGCKYKFEEYGIPQKRHRLIFAGFRTDLKVSFNHPQGVSDHKSCSAALEDVPSDAANHEPTRHSPVVEERLRHINPGENAFTANLPEHLRLNLKSNARISQIYKRLKPDEPAYTITASGGGGTHVYHWSEPRALTNRERARLQTFRDDFVFVGGRESVRRQIGMAVPPEGARIIFQAVLETLLRHRILPRENADSAR